MILPYEPLPHHQIESFQDSDGFREYKVRRVTTDAGHDLNYRPSQLLVFTTHRQWVKIPSSGLFQHTDIMEPTSSRAHVFIHTHSKYLGITPAEYLALVDFCEAHSNLNS